MHAKKTDLFYFYRLRYIFFLRQLQDVTRDRNNHSTGDRERQ